MPIEPSDSANTAFGIAPFGYHGADHTPRTAIRLGHRIPHRRHRARRGGRHRAERVSRSDHAGRFTVQLEHVVGTHHYRTLYTNLASVNAESRRREVVRAGQPIGTAGTLGTLGTIGTPGTYAMTHFQLDDLEFHREVPNPKAVSPEPFLSAEGKYAVRSHLARAAFGHELVEPFATNPRDLSFPASRTWTRAGGDGPAGIRFTRHRAQVAEYEYALLAESGTVIETGAVSINVTARPYPLIALTAPTSVRLGLYDIVSNELRLSLANPGSRPAPRSQRRERLSNDAGNQGSRGSRSSMGSKGIVLKSGSTGSLLVACGIDLDSTRKSPRK